MTNGCELNNVYNVGAIASNSDKIAQIGGFIGHIGVTFNGKITNSYNAGRVSGGNSSSDVGAICGYTRTDEGLNNIVTNCYWLDTSATRACGRDGEGNTIKVIDAELKATNMPEKLGTAWTRDNSLNNGYPILNGVNSNPPQLILNISTADQFRNFASAVNGGNRYQGYTVNLLKSIDLGNNVIEPINYFYGMFDGHGHTISGIYINSGDYRALFGIISSSTTVIKNLTIAGTVNGSVADYAGGFCAYAENSPTFENCVNAVNVNGGETAGGFIGHSYSGIPKIYNSYNTGTINSNSIGFYTYTGGIIGYIDERLCIE